MNNEVHRLMLQLGATNIVLTPDDLQRHPKSLLTEVASTTTAASNYSNESGSAPNSTVIVNLHKHAGGPFKEWLSALAVTEGLYRYGQIPSQVVRQALLELLNSGSSANGGCIGESCTDSQSWAAAGDALYDQATDLLSFLNIPGPLTRWLAKLDSFMLHEADMLRFVMQCSARDAVHTMMKHCPFSRLQQQQGIYVSGIAAFLVQANPSSGDPLLTTYVAQWHQLLFKALTPLSPAQLADSLTTPVPVTVTGDIVGGRTATPFCWCKLGGDEQCCMNQSGLYDQAELRGDDDTFICSSHFIGQNIARALTAAVSGLPDVRVGCVMCTLPSCINANGTVTLGVRVPLWVVYWL